MAKKINKTATVKNPKIGDTYFFRFAGMIYRGKYIRECTSLSKQYGCLYMWFNSDADIPNIDGKLISYPISIKEIATNLEDF